MTGLEYEKLVAKYLRKHGYHRVSVTRGSGDYGVDVIAHKGKHKFAVQCKYYNSAVSLDAVQEAVAGMAVYGCDRAMVVTNSTFTQAAIQLAKSNGVVLLEGIVSTGFTFHFKYLMALLIGIYAFVALAGLSAAFDAIKQQPFWTALLNAVTTVPVITAPFWIWVIFILVRKKKQNKKQIKATCAGNTELHQKARYADAEKIQKAILKIDVAFDLSVLSLLTESNTLSVAKLQRTLKIGYARAGRIKDYLLENGYIEQTETYIYEWSYAAK